MDLFLKAILAGFCIGIACIIYLMCPNPIIGAALFGLGLMNLRLMGYPLYTGKVQTLTECEDVSETLGGIGILMLMFMANLVGIALAFYLGTWAIPGLAGLASTLALNKLALGLLETFGRGILCGYLMTIATRPSTPLWMTPLCVFAFVYCGFNHSVADSFYYMTQPYYNILPHLAITWAGNLFGGVAGALLTPRQQQAPQQSQSTDKC